MPRAPPPFMVVLTVVALFIWYVIYVGDKREETHRQTSTAPELFSHLAPQIAPEAQHGHAIMSKLGNETMKAELGRAAWKLFHTTMARFPENPTHDESDALKSYVYLFARLYPCGECAQHFQQILKRFPPQTSSRNIAAGWACHVHNEVNKSKNKPLFDCNNIGDFYDCGCAEDDEMLPTADTKASGEPRAEPVEIIREGPTRGG